MTTETGRPSGGGLPETLGELIAALVELRDEPDPIERALRSRELKRASRAVLDAVTRAAMEEALDLPRMTKRALAERLGIHESKVYGRTRPRRKG